MVSWGSPSPKPPLPQPYEAHTDLLSWSPVPRFIKYTGYGNAAGLLAARGLMAGGRPEGQYSEDEDTDTEEYKEAKARFVPLIHMRVPLYIPRSLTPFTPNQNQQNTGQDEEQVRPKVRPLCPECTEAQQVSPLGTRGGGSPF